MTETIESSLVKDENGNYLGIKDELFKAIIFSNQRRRDWFVGKILGREVNGSILLSETLPINNKREKSKYADIVVKADEDTYLLIEANIQDSESTRIRNYCYASNLYSQITKKGTKYSLTKKVYGIDISRGIPKKDEVLEMYPPQNKIGKKYVQNFGTLVYNVDKLRQSWYDGNEEDIREYSYIIMLVLGNDELRKLTECEYLGKVDREEIESYREELERMNGPEDYTPWITPEEDQRMWENTFRSEGREEGKTIGREEGEVIGEEKAHNEAIKNMAKDHMPADLISKYLNIPLSKVKKVLSTIVL